LSAASAPGVPRELVEGARGLAASEASHALAFRSLARALSPRLYSNAECVFVTSPKGFVRMIWTLFAARPFRPLLLWIAFILEERAVFFGEEILRQAQQLDPRVVAWHRRHIADEGDHIGLGEALRPLYWARTPSWLRRVNSRLLRFVLREFLGAPKRAGLRVIDCWLEERPELKPRRAELLAALRELDSNPAFHESLYSRRSVPKTFALFDRYEEFRDLGKSLWGYAPEAVR
jgi:hypothetical protein